MNRVSTRRLNKDEVLGAIGLNPGPLARKALQEVFGLAPSEHARLDKILKKLEQEGLIALNARKEYLASNPVADLAIAKVETLDSKGRAQLKLAGLSNEFNYPVLASRKQTKKTKPRPGDSFLVSLRRYNKIELRAHFMEKVSPGSLPSVEIAFNGAAKQEEGAHCHTLDANIKTTFKALFDDTKKTRRLEGAWKGEIPADYDPRQPALLVSRQTHEKSSGNFIPHILSRKHGLRIQHDKAIRNEAKELAKTSPDMSFRRDMTNLPVLVIDPENPFDRDDGVHISLDPESGQFTSVTVLSDVAERVRPGTLTFEEARSRGFSHFFNNDKKAFPMLPPVLVKSCSLHEGARRPVIFCETQWDRDGTEIDTHIGLGMIASQKCLSYQEMEDKMRETHARSYPDDQDADMIHYEAYRSFTQLVMGRYRQDFESIEAAPKSEKIYAPDAQFLVHFLMTHSNTQIARFLNENNVPSLYRVHKPGPSRKLYGRIRDTLALQGYTLPQSLNDVTLDDLSMLEAPQGRTFTRPEIKDHIRKLIARAEYSTRPDMHYALGVQPYAHASSPIRRFADLMVQKSLHRVLKPSPAHEQTGLSKEEENQLEKICQEVNQQELRLERVQQDYARFHHIQDLKRFEGQKIKTIIHAIRHGELDILHHKNGLIKTIPEDKLPEGWRLDGEKQKLLTFATENKKNTPPASYKKGDLISGILTSVSPEDADWNIRITEARPARDFAPVDSVPPPAPEPPG